jgi:hypothetical protein
MKAATRLAILAASLAGIAALAYSATNRFLPHRPPAPSAQETQQNGLRWLRDHYQLDESTWLRIAALHEAYYPVCGDMCARIAAANAKVAELMQQSDRFSPELETALRSAEATHADCRAALLRHVYEVAALMPPDASRRYLAEMAPRLLHEGRHADEIMAPRPHP